MNRFLLPIFAIFLAALPAAESLEDCLGNCGKTHLFPMGGKSKPGRKYARDRLVDVKHLALDVTPNFETRSISGTAKLTFSPIGKPLGKFELDAIDLTLEEVTAEGSKLASWQREEEQLDLNFVDPIAVGTSVTITVKYRCQPANGLHFRTPAMGYPATDTQVWSQGEAEFHRYWFPCYDYPNERFSSEVTCHVPEGMEVVSNGKLVSKAPDAAGMIAWHWLQEDPHVNYLIALAAGHFHKLESSTGKVPMALLVPPSEKDQAELAFRDTQKIFEFFEREIGVDYPWVKYHQVYCIDFLAGGMENTSCSFMALSALFPKEVGLLDSVHRLDAHELAHQWFGDLLTCRDWSHLWLNEGFASYYTVLYEEQREGRDGFLLSLRKEGQRVIESNDTRPMVWRDYTDPMQQFDSRAYPKGAWVLHMLRSQLGKELYQEAVRKYVQRHRNGIVTTDDLQEVFEEVSGRSFDQFFDQWVHHGGVPELEAQYKWDEKTKMARVSIRQKQKVDEKVLLFNLPVPVRFYHEKDGQFVSQDFMIQVSKAEEEFYFKLDAAPKMTRLDPDLTVLAKWTGAAHSDSIDTQLQKGDFLTRLLAVGGLASSRDEETVKKLVQVATTDAHYAVRSEAIKSLQGIGTDSARTALLEQLSQPDERVRLAAVEALGTIYHRDARDRLATFATQEKNPMLVAKSLSGLAAWPDFDPKPFLKMPSYQGMIAAAAIGTLGSQNRQEATGEIMETLTANIGILPGREIGRALQTLGALSRGKLNSPEQQFILKYLSSPQGSVRSAAATALGEQGDPASLPVLRGLANVSQDQASGPAADAISKIQARLNAPEQSQAAWKKVEALERKSSELEQKLEALEKKLKPQ